MLQAVKAADTLWFKQAVRIGWLDSATVQLLFAVVT